ncbi:hypothetical protein Nepgr_005519 [Nepenthes gracilis]|uniref:Uncharacterized protein n=1 Tax=Nepenthes gracilis TaxID=150966 RepID=A0AAD3S3N7_NEPGR|nr:hypothetical protein Nepgr_005519 [Nepenthes gracilis]
MWAAANEALAQKPHSRWLVLLLFRWGKEKGVSERDEKDPHTVCSLQSAEFSPTEEPLCRLWFPIRS